MSNTERNMSQKIVVVDDSSFMHSMYDMVLRSCSNCEIVHAMNGQEALDELGQCSEFNLIILDINMPEMSGLEFMEKYKSSGLPASVPIIIASTEGTENDTQRGLDAGAMAYLKKPFQPSDLQELVNGVLGSGRDQKAV